VHGQFITIPMLTRFAFVLAILCNLYAGCHALTATDEKYCRVYPDPHFNIFHGDWYDFHGGCDVILLKSNLLNIHLRTHPFGGWAGILNAAVRVGSDILEVQPGGIVLVNRADVTGAPPGTIGGYTFTVSAGPPQTYRLDLAGSQYVEITRSYSDTLQIDVRAHGSDFFDATAMCGHWSANSPNALVGRNGTVFGLGMGTAFGEEWQVDLAVDPNLFNATGETNCTYNSNAYCGRDLKNCPAACVPGQTCCVDATGKQCKCNDPANPNCKPVQPTRKLYQRSLEDFYDVANATCQNVTEERNAKGNCIFDVLTTGDVAVAQSPAYTNALVGEPEDQCVEKSTTAECSKKEGKCVWRCDSALNHCAQGLCSPKPNFTATGGTTASKTVVDGCSCEIPYNKTSLPCKDPDQCKWLGIVSGYKVKIKIAGFCFSVCSAFITKALLSLGWACGGCR
jgi:hypothetical protein